MGRSRRFEIEWPKNCPGPALLWSKGWCFLLGFCDESWSVESLGIVVRDTLGEREMDERFMQPIRNPSRDSKAMAKSKEQ